MIESFHGVMNIQYFDHRDGMEENNQVACELKKDGATLLTIYTNDLWK